MSSSAHRALHPLLLAAALILGSCSKPPAGPPPGLVVVRFENLSDDRSLEWLGRGAAEVLTTTLTGAVEGTVISTAAISRLEAAQGGRPVVAPGISTQRGASVLSGAKRIIFGTFHKTPAGSVRFELTEQEFPSGKIIRNLSETGPATLDTLLKLSRQVSPAVHPYLTSSTDALRAWVQAVELPPAEAATLLRQAVVADPGFGPPWLALVRIVNGSGDATEALRLVNQALALKLDRLTLATLKLDKATFESDEPGRASALAEIIEASPGDTPLLRQLAQARSSAGQFADAATLWQKLTVALPDDPDGWNQLGYNRAWAGDYLGAVAAMREYARIRPTDPNPDDSIGDIHFMYRKFTEAANSYQASITKMPFFEGGASLYKGAWAKYYAGDKAGADKLFAQFRTEHEKKGTPNLDIFEADWLYRTGRQQQAVTFLREAVLKLDKVDAQVACYEILVVWDLLAGDREAAAKDAKAVGQPRAASAAIIQFVALPSAPVAEWLARAEKMLPGPQLAGIRNLAVGYAILLDGKRAEAIPVWDRIITTVPPGDFPLHALYARLKGNQPKLAVVPSQLTVNQFAALIDKP